MKKAIFVLIVLQSASAVFCQTIQEASRFFYVENFAEAKNAYNSILTKEPKNEEAVYWYIASCLRSDNNEDARKMLDNKKAQIQASAWYTAANGYFLLHNGNTAAAKTAFEKAIDLSSASSELKAGILQAAGSAHGWVRMKHSSPDYGISKLNEALKLKPSNSSIYINLGDCYRKKLDGGNAVQSYMKAKELNPQLAQADYCTGKVYATQQNCPVFEEYFTTALKTDPQFTPAYRELFENFSDTESPCFNKEKASGYLTPYTALLTDKLQAKSIAINFLYTKGDYIAAIAEGMKAIKEPGAKPWIYATIASSYEKQKNCPEAIKWFNEYFKQAVTNSDISNAYRQMAGCQVELKDYAGANESYHTAFALNNDTLSKLRACTLAASAFDKASQFAFAADFYKKIIELKRNPIAADYYKAGVAFYNAKIYSDASSVFKTYSQKFSSDWRGPLWQARCASQMDSLMKTGEAAPFYEQYLAIGEKDPANKKANIEAYTFLFGYSYNFKKDKALAVSYLDKILALEPTNALALQYKAKLK